MTCYPGCFGQYRGFNKHCADVCTCNEPCIVETEYLNANDKSKTGIVDHIIIEKHASIGKSESLLNQGVFWHLTTNWNEGKSMLSIRDRKDEVILFSTPCFKENEMPFHAEVTRQVINLFNSAFHKETLDVQIQTSRSVHKMQATQR